MPKLSNKPWGSVDKTELLKYVINHPEKAKDVYIKIGKNWQEDPYNRLSYPIADKNGTVYRYGLSSALAYAKANNETEVVSKVKKLYKKFGIDEQAERKIIEAYISEDIRGNKYEV